MPKKFAEKVRKNVGPLQASSTIIPDSVVSKICSSAGFVTEDVRIIRAIALATQAYMANITNGAMHHCKVRLRTTTIKSSQFGQQFKDSKLSLTMEDLSPALKDHGIVCKKPPYFV